MNLHPLLQQVHTIGRSANTPDERAIRSSVTAAELRLWSKTHLAPERMTCRAAPQRAKRGGYLFGEWRGTAPQPQANAPCGVCLRHMEDDERFVFSGWIVHRRYVVESAEGAADRGDDRFRVAIGGVTAPSRRRAFLPTEKVPMIHMR